MQSEPGAWFFKPQGVPLRELDVVELRLDEFEALRLADAELLHHARAAALMGISRQTFGLIVRSARTKIANALLRGAALRISTVQEGSHDRSSTNGCQ